LQMDGLADHDKALGRPPADRLFCRGGACAVRPEMAEGERAHFAEHFAESFGAAMNEARGGAPSGGDFPLQTLSPQGDRA
jgi:hypothetical protein